MRYFIEIVTPSKTIADPEGAEFPDLAAAESEAAEVVRELTAEELRAGRPMPGDWMIRIHRGDGEMESLLPFRWYLATADRASAARLPAPAAVQLRRFEALLPQVMAHARAARAQQQAINHHLELLRLNLRALSELKSGS